MHTTRAAADRLLDPTRPEVTVDSLQRAASALGLTPNMTFKPAGKSPTAKGRSHRGRRK